MLQVHQILEPFFFLLRMKAAGHTSQLTKLLHEQEFPSQSLKMLENQIPSCERIGVSMSYTVALRELLGGSTGDAPTKKNAEHGLHEPISEHRSRINRNSPYFGAWNLAQSIAGDHYQHHFAGAVFGVASKAISIHILVIYDHLIMSYNHQPSL